MKSIKTNKTKTTKTIAAPAQRTVEPVKVPAAMAQPKRETMPAPAAASVPAAGRIITSELKSPRAATPASARAITPEEIARRAYAIWEAQGRPAGKATEHWLQAESQLKTSQSFTE